MGVLLRKVVYSVDHINNTTMRIDYIQPDACEIEAWCLDLLAQSPTETDGSLEGFNNEFPSIEW